jgi:hypothetical protein
MPPPLLLAFLLLHTAHSFPVLPLRQPRPKAFTVMSLSKVSLHFDFDRIPYAAGIQHIHSPEHVSETHRLGAPFFKIDSVSRPNLSSRDRTSISFVCSTLFIKDMRVRMFSHQPNESNMLFFKDGRALYGVRFTVVPTKVLLVSIDLQPPTHPLPAQSFLSHRLRLDVTFFKGNEHFRATLKSLMPIFMFVNGMEDQCGYRLPPKENANFTEYRRGVLRGKGADEYWLMAERILREYTD